MRVVGFAAFGDPSVLSVTDRPLPEPGAGQVRVRVAAAAINPADLAARAGSFGPMLPPGPYYVTGWDVAGTVHAAGPGVTSVAVGDSVIAMSEWLATRNGTHAEYVVLDAAEVALAPAGITPALAATIPASALTADQALDLLGLVDGQTLAVTGAGGSVGGFAVELARHRGLAVLGIGGAADERFITRTGAVFLARSADPAGALLAAAPGGVDGLLDAAVIGPPALAAVADGGVFVSMIPPEAPEPERGIRVVGLQVRSDGARLRWLASLAERGHITPRLAASFSFDQAAAAHELAGTSGVRGRVVLVP